MSNLTISQHAIKLTAPSTIFAPCAASPNHQLFLGCLFLLMILGLLLIFLEIAKTATSLLLGAAQEIPGCGDLRKRGEEWDLGSRKIDGVSRLRGEEEEKQSLV